MMDTRLNLRAGIASIRNCQISLTRWRLLKIISLEREWLDKISNRACKSHFFLLCCNLITIIFLGGRASYHVVIY